MEENVDHVKLVAKAQLGDKACLNRLAEAARVRLYPYVYRYTLSDELTQDIVQETILKMLEVLNELKEADSFWPWLFKIALNKILINRRAEQKRRTVPKSAANLADNQHERQAARSVSTGITSVASVETYVYLEALKVPRAARGKASCS